VGGSEERGRLLSIKVMTLVFETPLAPTDKLVALCLADHSHWRGAA
jgi:hypothetical protein